LANKTQNTVAPVNRSSAGLRDAIFDEIDAIRNGTGNPTRANAVAKLAATVVETVRMELEVQRYANATASQVKTSETIEGLPRPLALGA
jgi:hypothetical protein